MIVAVGVLVRRPRLGLGVEREQRLVGLGADDVAVLGRDAREGLVELGVDEQHRRAGVLDDVAHLVDVQAEVDRDEDAPESTDAEERRHEAGAVLAHDRDALALADAEPVEARRLGSCELGDPLVGEVTPRGCGLVGLVDETDAVAVDELRVPDEVVHSQRNLHAANSTHGP